MNTAVYTSKRIHLISRKTGRFWTLLGEEAGVGYTVGRHEPGSDGRDFKEFQVITEAELEERFTRYSDLDEYRAGWHEIWEWKFLPSDSAGYAKSRAVRKDGSCGYTEDIEQWAEKTVEQVLRDVSVLPDKHFAELMANMESARKAPDAIRLSWRIDGKSDQEMAESDEMPF